MSNITRFDPCTVLIRLDPFGDFDDMFKDFVMRPVFQGAPAAPQMKLDVSEDDKAYTIKAEIPGVKKVVHSERYFGQVSRSFTLDKEVEQATATAKYADGVLEAVLPKNQGTAARQISVS